jgi:hypothetical protein
MRRPDRERLIGTSSAATEGSPLRSEASVYYLPRDKSCPGLPAEPARMEAAVNDRFSTAGWGSAAPGGSARNSGRRSYGDQAATAVWVALLIRRVLLELELANLDLERSRLVVENQMYRSLLHSEAAATQRG